MRLPLRIMILLSLLSAGCARLSAAAPVADTAFIGAAGFELPAENLRLAAEYSAAHDGFSLLVMLDGQVIFEDYPDHRNPERPLELASGTKSFSCALAAAAQADGLLTLDERVADTLEEWRGDPRKAEITIRQLLSLTSGLEDEHATGDVPTYAEAIAAAAVHPPGQVFQYGPVPFQVFGEVMRRKLQAQALTPLEYLQARVFDPIGLEVGRWRRGADGNPQLPSGAALSAREWVKYGELVRRAGSWQGRQVLPAEALESCLQGTAANPAYGLSWWLNREVGADLRAAIPQFGNGTDYLWPQADMPSDLVYAAGMGKQRLYIIRSFGLVVVRQADNLAASLLARERSDFSDAAFLGLLLTGR